MKHITERKIRKWLKGIKFKLNPQIIASAKAEKAWLKKLRATKGAT